MFALKDSKKVNQRTRYIVHGWIRNEENALKFGNVPAIIVASCILYYRNDEIFDIVGNGMKLSANKKVITKVRNGCSFTGNHFGLNQIDSTSELLYSWHLLIKQDIMDSTGFGISSHLLSTKKMANDCFDHAHQRGIFFLFREGYKMSHEIMEYENYIKPWKVGDRVSLCLDMKRAEISLIVNGHNQGIAFRNIQKSKQIQYRFFVSFYCIGDSVEILDFTIQ